MDIIEKIAGNIDLSTNERIKAIRLEMINKYDLFHHKSSKIKSDLGKKLCQFIKMISNLYKRRILRHHSRLDKKSIIKKMILIFIRKSAGSYLRLEDIEELYSRYSKKKN